MTVLLGCSGIALRPSPDVKETEQFSMLQLDRQRATDLLRPYQADLKTIQELRTLLGITPGGQQVSERDVLAEVAKKIESHEIAVVRLELQPTFQGGGGVAAAAAEEEPPPRAELTEEVQALHNQQPYLPLEKAREPETPSYQPIRLMIRNAQLAAFRLSVMQNFENRMVEHLNRFFARRFRQMGESQARELIREGIGRAGKYGFRSEQEICRFVDLMMVFGSRFDQEAEWAEHVLLSPGQHDRLSQLLDRAKVQLRAA